MATRDNLPMIRAARTGAASAQLALGSHYFFGKSGLAQSTGTAFYWLERAARQGLEDACLMIGRHVPYEVVATMRRPYEAAPWYEKAFDAGVMQAGLVFARLVLDNTTAFPPASRDKALRVLHTLTQEDDPQAQWMLAQYLQESGEQPGALPGADESSTSLREQELVMKAANAGIEGAQYCLLAQAWENADVDTFLPLASPIAQRLLARHQRVANQLRDAPPQEPALALEPYEADLLLRLASILQAREASGIEQARALLEVTAIGGVAEARYRLGLLHAGIDATGQRAYAEHGIANYRKSVTWLLLAAHDGHAAAWHALSRVYARSEFSQRDLPTSRRYLERAAELGLADTQLEYAQASWRNRRDDARNDIRAIYWWLKAAKQGQAQAQQALEQFSPRPAKGAWACQILERLTTKVRRANPFMFTRLELAASFGLSRPEALLLDIRRSDHGHCLEIDISQYHGRSRRRLVLVADMEQRVLLNLAGRMFGDVDCSYNGPEGNYRQRQYKLSCLINGVA